jgi:hypothetical protein
MQQVGLEILDILMPSTIIEVVEHIQITFWENIIWLIHTWRLIRKHFQYGSFRKQLIVQGNGYKFVKCNSSTKSFHIVQDVIVFIQIPTSHT